MNHISIFIFYFIYLFIIYGCVGSSFLCKGFLSLWQVGPLFITVRGPLTIAASLVVEHRLQTRRLSNCGSRAQPLRGIWDPPRSGPEPVPLHWQADSQPLRHQGSPLLVPFTPLFPVYLQR